MLCAQSMCSYCCSLIKITLHKVAGFTQGGKLHTYSHMTFTGSVWLGVLEEFALLVCSYRFAIIKGSHELQQQNTLQDPF